MSEKSDETTILKPLTAVLLGAILFVAAMTMASASNAMASIEESSIDSICIDQITDEMHKTSSQIDNEKTKALASQNDDYNSRIAGYEARFNSVYNIWTFDMAGCHASEIQSVNVVYNLYNSTGHYVKNIVVTVDPLITKVIEISEHVGAFYAHSSNSINWAALELTANSFTWSTPPSCTSTSDPDCVWQARATWTQPSVSRPSNPSTACRTDLSYQPCDLAIWTGLQDAFGASNSRLVQTGSDAKITCTSSTNCPVSYFFWYQIGATNPATICSGFTFNPGHGVSAIVTNQNKNGGLDTRYDISIINTSTGVGCGVSGANYSFMTRPTIASFVNERAAYNPPAYATLAQFSSDTVTGFMRYNGSEKGISTPYSNGWYNQVRMVNTAINIGYPAVSGNSMTFTWSTSANT